MAGQWSPDGKWFWDGSQWNCAISNDGAWRFNGTQWERWSGGPAGPMPPTPPAAPPVVRQPDVGTREDVYRATPAGTPLRGLPGDTHPRADTLSIALAAFGLYFRHLLGFVLVALPAVLALGLVMVGADLGLGIAEHVTAFVKAHSDPNGNFWTPDAFDLLTRLAIYAAACAVATLILCPLALGALCLAAGRAEEGQQFSIGECYALAARRYFHLLTAAIVMTLVPSLVLSAFTAFALVTGLRFVLLGQLCTALGLRLSLAPAAIMLDGEGVLGGLVQSWRVSSGRRFFALAFLVIFFGCVVGLPPLVMAGLPAGASPDMTVTLRIGEALGAITGAITAPLAGIVLTVAYRRWR